MPAVGPALGALIMNKVDANMKAIAGFSPLSQKNPSYFIAKCMAIGNGIALGAPTISFVTKDTGQAGAPPIPGTGTGVGIIVDSDWYTKELYTRLRASAIEDFGSTTHGPYPPPPDDSGKYLEAMCKGISEAVKQHFATAWILTSAHPIVYAGIGNIGNGDFAGVVPTKISTLIQTQAPQLRGRFWPKFCKIVGEVHSQAIMQHSTSKVTIVGVCVPSPGQVCGLPIPGTGTGVAA